MAYNIAKCFLFDYDDVMKLLDVKPFQETLHGGFCGVACLKMVLEYYGVMKTETDLSLLMNKDDVLGVGEDDIKRTAENLGFKVSIKDFSSYQDIEEFLEMQIPVIVDWFTRGRNDYSESEVADGHYSIVIGLDDRDIYLQDPEIGDVRKIARDDFMRVWFDFKTNHIESWNDMIIRQIISITPK